MSASDTSAEARYYAAYTLGKIGAPSVIEPLLEALADPHPHVRRGAVTGFSSSGFPKRLADDRVVAALVGALADPEDRVGAIAAWALARLGDRTAVPAPVALAEGPQTDAVADAL